MRIPRAVLMLLALLPACTLLPPEGEQLRTRQMEEAVLPMAATALDSGQLETARRLYRRLLDVDPASVSARMGLGRVALLEQEPAAAARWFLSALHHAEQATHRHDALLAHGRAALAAGQVEAAGHSFSRLIDGEDSPPRATEAWGHNGVGLTRLLSGDSRGAVASLERAVLLAPEEDRFQGNLERALAMQGGFPIPDRAGEESEPEMENEAVPRAQATVAGPAAAETQPSPIKSSGPPRSSRPSVAETTDLSPAPEPLAPDANDPTPEPDPSAVETTESPRPSGFPNGPDRVDHDSAVPRLEPPLKPAPNRSPGLDTDSAAPRSDGPRDPEAAPRDLEQETPRQPIEAQDDTVPFVAEPPPNGSDREPQPVTAPDNAGEADRDATSKPGTKPEVSANLDVNATPAADVIPDADGSAIAHAPVTVVPVLIVTEIDGRYLQFGAYAEPERAEAVAAGLRPLTDHPTTISETSDANGAALHRVRIGPIPAGGGLLASVSALESHGYRFGNSLPPAAAAGESAATPPPGWNPWAVTADGERYLQVGAFQERATADSLATELRAQTDRPVRVSDFVQENGPTLHRVRIGPLAPDDSPAELLESLQ